MLRPSSRQPKDTLFYTAWSMYNLRIRICILMCVSIFGHGQVVQLSSWKRMKTTLPTTMPLRQRKIITQLCQSLQIHPTLQLVRSRLIRQESSLILKWLWNVTICQEWAGTNTWHRRPCKISLQRSCKHTTSVMVHSSTIRASLRFWSESSR